MGNFNPKLPTKHVGTNKYITFFVTRNRIPTLADYRQPETGTLYSIGTVWAVSKDPTTGTEGDLYMLSKIVSNQGYWTLISSGQGNLDSIMVDTFTAPGTNPVVATSGGLITVTGGQIANAGLANVIRTDSLAANTFTIEIQQAGSDSVANATKNGVSHYNSAHFVLGANAFVSSQIATTSQIGIVTLATQAQSEYNTYGTTQVLQSGNIAFMMAKPAPIGSTTPNTGSFTSLVSNATQVFSAAVGVFPVLNVTALSNVFNVGNTTIRSHMTATVPASIGAGFANNHDMLIQITDGTEINATSFTAIMDNVTPGAAASHMQINVFSTIAVTGLSIYPTRIELGATTSRYRVGPGGVDFMSGTGDPNGGVTAAKGSYYARLDGSSTSTRAYINTDGATAWTAVTTAT